MMALVLSACAVRVNETASFSSCKCFGKPTRRAAGDDRSEPLDEGSSIARKALGHDALEIAGLQGSVTFDRHRTSAMQTVRKLRQSALMRYGLSASRALSD